MSRPGQLFKINTGGLSDFQFVNNLKNYFEKLSCQYTLSRRTCS